MIHYLLENNLDGTYNAVSSTPITQEQLNSFIAKYFNTSFIIPTLPTFLFKTILGERSALILDSQKVSNEKILTSGFSFQFDDIPSALEDIYR